MPDGILNEPTIRRIGAEVDLLRVASKTLAANLAFQPVDLPAVKQQFLRAFGAGSLEMPVVEYSDSQPDPVVLSELDAVGRGDSIFDPLLREKVCRLERTVKMVSDGSPEYITGRSVDDFGEVDSKLLNKAHEILLMPVEASASPTVPISELMDALYRCLDFLEFGGWEIRVDDSLFANLSIRPQARLIRLRSDFEVTAEGVRRLCVHEICTHVARFEYGQRQGYSFLSEPLTPYLRTEEGLAVFNEERNELLSTSDLRKYALRVVAIDRSFAAGFDSVFQELCTHTDPGAAFDIALRAKRGFRDLSSKGAYVRDISYLAGLMEIRKLGEEAPEAIDLLMSCKQSLEMLPLLNDLNREGVISIPEDRTVEMLESVFG